VIPLAVRKIGEEALESEVRDPGRERYERGRACAAAEPTVLEWSPDDHGPGLRARECLHRPTRRKIIVGKLYGP